MTNVVSLRRPDPLIWQCACGCSTFRVYSDHTMKCAACDAHTPCEWVSELPDTPAEPKKAIKETRTISYNDASPAAALRLMMQKVDPETLVALIAINEDGRVRTWGGIDTDDRREWLGRRMEEAEELLTVFVPGEVGP